MGNTLLTYWHRMTDAVTRGVQRASVWVSATWQRFVEWSRPVWERVAVWTKPARELVKKWAGIAWSYLVKWYNKAVNWYANQQEVIKKQSEVSHERITMKRAILAFMETWGLGSRNIFYTMWHLIWRPGYMISDYLNGRRQYYLQPFFMFFVLTLILVQMAWALDVQLPKNRDMTLVAFDLLSDHSSWFSVKQMTIIFKTAEWIDRVHEWRNLNRSWDIIIHSLGIVLITWLLWRKSPRIGMGEWVIGSGTVIEGYNFAEIVTVIAYILCQLQMLSMVAMIFFHKLPFDHIQGFAIIPALVLFVILLIDFKQLFQRRWWATIWRSLLIVLFI